MNLQRFSPARTASGCRDALQLKSCTDYMSMHDSAYLKSRLISHILSYRRFSSSYISPCDIGALAKNISLVSRTSNEPKYSGIACPLVGCSSAHQRQFSPIDKHIKFNRMNGSPGKPPAHRMHISKQKESLLLFSVSRVIQSARRPAGRQQHKEIQ